MNIYTTHLLTSRKWVPPTLLEAQAANPLLCLFTGPPQGHWEEQPSDIAYVVEDDMVVSRKLFYAIRNHFENTHRMHPFVPFGIIS